MTDEELNLYVEEKKTFFTNPETFGILKTM
jgi:hypothetical protein